MGFAAYKWRNAIRHLAFGMAAIASSQPTLACSLAMPPQQQTGESTDAFKARLKAIEDERRRYQNATERERAAIDQSRWWDESPMVFLARVEKVKVGKTIFGMESLRPIGAGLRYRHGRPLPPKPVLPPPFFELNASHAAFVRPLRWLKGPPDFNASWQEVGGMTSCGKLDGSLGYTYPGEQVIIFAELGSVFHQSRGAWVESKKFRLFGVEPSDAAEARLIVALKDIKGGHD